MSQLVDIRGVTVVVVILMLAGTGMAQDAAKKKQPPVQGTLKYGSRTYKLSHGIAYTNKDSDGEVRDTEICLTAKPYPRDALARLKKELQKNGNDDEYFIFEPLLIVFVHVTKDNATGVNIMLDDGGGFNLVKTVEKIKVADGRAKGSVKMPEPDEVFDTEYQLEVQFDLEIMK